ncbi:MAG: hypothetical protein R8G66_07510 [Cytophagales bacterium]|nr:hypothetical protein [Cytophagales bacterium]
MKYFLILILSCLLFGSAIAQEENPLTALEPLMGKTWAIDAQWGDGSVFKQELSLEYGLQNQVVYCYTKGFINAERTQFGDRNFGIRKFDKESGKILFWEFDAFGGVTEGEVIANGRDLWFVYNYGETVIADIWEYLDDETYAFRVVSYNNEEIGDMYLKGAYKVKR